MRNAGKNKIKELIKKLDIIERELKVEKLKNQIGESDLKVEFGLDDDGVRIYKVVENDIVHKDYSEHNNPYIIKSYLANYRTEKEARDAIKHLNKGVK